MDVKNLMFCWILLEFGLFKGVYFVGWLDCDSEGLLLFMDDGGF